MHSVEDLVPGSVSSANIEFRKYKSPLTTGDAQVLRDVYRRVGAPHNWKNSRWSEEQWDEWLARTDRHRWIAFVDGEPAGLIDVEPHGNGDVEIQTFGLVPEFVGRGFGGHILTLGTRLAWEVEPDDGVPPKRVWLHTQTTDHAHALSNHLARGFRPFRTEILREAE